MKFTDEGYIINTRKYGESSLILTVVTRSHGLLSGFVKGGMSKKNLGIYQIGNQISLEAYARIEENMLSFKVELISPSAVNFLNSPQKLSALSALCSLLNECLPEKEPLERFYYYLDSFFQLINEDNWITHYCYLEFYLLEYLGIGLDLTECAATGTTEHLSYISPKSSKAVCAESGEAYKDKMFLYPHFIVDKNYAPSLMEMADLLKMTEFFLNKNFFQTHNLKFPKNRATLLANLGLNNAKD